MAKLNSSRPPTILVVDDDSNTRGLLTAMLEQENFRVAQAMDGLEALKRLKEQAVDLIITDRSMPHMDGMALLAELQKQKSTIPVLMISAYGEESMWSQAIGRGAKDYLLKPFKAEDVVTQIRKYLKGPSK